MISTVKSSEWNRMSAKTKVALATMFDALAKQQRRSASCPGCGQQVRVCIPKGGDGSVDVYVRHKLRNGSQCGWSRRTVGEKL